MEYQKNKKVILQVANIIIVLLLFSSCFSTRNKIVRERILPSYKNNAGYIWDMQSPKKIAKDSFCITINLIEKGKTFPLPAVLESGCTKITIDKGKKTFKLPISTIETQFSIKSVGYYTIDTKPHLFTNKDSLCLTIIMSEDDRTLIDCNQ